MEEVEFLKFIVGHLVSHKEDIKIERKEDEMGVLLTLKVHSDDMGTIIWKAWNTINSIRTILRIFGMKMDKRLNMKVLD